MSTSQNFPIFLGAGVVGIICAAAVFVIEHVRQEKRRHGMAKDLAKLNTEMSLMRKELDALLQAQQTTKAKSGKSVSRKMRATKANSTTSSTTEDYMSALDLDSSDLEFYDVSDYDDEENDEKVVNREENEENISLEQILATIDEILEENHEGTLKLKQCLKKLNELNNLYKNNPNILWRIGKVNYKLYKTLTDDDKEMKLTYINDGIDACNEAINYLPKLSNVHKWLAILIGTRIDYLSMKDKLNDSRIFKEHLLLAIELNSNDPILYHMYGQFIYEFASLKWYERKVASTFYSEINQFNYQQAIDNCLIAEQLLDHNWLDNKLLIAKCYLGLNDLSEGIEWLKQAKDAQTTGNGVDGKVEKELKELLAKYCS